MEVPAVLGEEFLTLLEQPQLVVASRQTIMDEKYEQLLTPLTTTPSRLMATVEEGAAVSAVDMSMGTIVDLSKVVELLTPHNATLEFVDLSFSRIDETQAAHVEALLNLVREKNGAVVVNGNPIATTDGKQFFEDLALQQNKIELLLSLIWIPKAWLAGQHWRNVLGNKVSNDVAHAVHLSHVSFYRRIQQLRNRLAHSKHTSIAKLRILLD